MYRHLDAQKIVDTASALHSRISERFPGSSLGNLSGEVLAAARETLGKLAWIQKPHVPLNVAIYGLIAAIIGVLVVWLATLRASDLREVGTFIQVLEAGLSSLFFIGATLLYLVSWEKRLKRNRALKAIHELRAMAHIVDMHQLTKDPEAACTRRTDTTSSPKRTLTPFELGRYLDYCSELFSLIGKIAALYAQSLDDPIVLDAVDDIEDLTTELSQKVWQKIAVLNRMLAAASQPAPAPAE